MRETLRLQPPASSRTVSSIEDTTLLNGKYAVKAGIPIVSQVWVSMRDPAVWGEDALAFRPERMMDGKFEALPVRLLPFSVLAAKLIILKPNAWQPFGKQESHIRLAI